MNLTWMLNFHVRSGICNAVSIVPRVRVRVWIRARLRVRVGLIYIVHKRKNDGRLAV